MNKREMILIAFAPAKGAVHTPVQVQKLLFLIDREISEFTGGPHFNFQPYNYGPFDETVYDEIMTLVKDDYIEIVQGMSWNSYRLTKKGQNEGDKLLSSLEPKAKNFIEEVSELVQSLSFSQLVSAIYKAYPDMKVNSVFQDI